MKLENFNIIDNDGVYIGEFEEYLNKILSENGLSIIDKKDSNSSIIEKLKSNPDDLTKDEIVRIAKLTKSPINSFDNFYMVNQNFGFIELNMKNNELVLFLTLAHMLNNGTSINHYKNKKCISTIEDLISILNISESTFYRAKSGLEKKRLIKFQKIGERFAILFNPIYVKKGKISELTFREFKNEIAQHNYLWYLYLRKELLESSDLILMYKK